MKFIICLSVFFLMSSLTFAQNLVNNPSFESYLNCNFNQGDADFATGWYKSPVFNQPPSHADYCNSCSNSYGVPNNPWGTESAATGNGYMSITTKVPAWGQYRENIYSQLINPLIIGVTYSLSFKLSLCDNFQLASDKMGLKFSMFPNIAVSNSAHLFASSPVTQQNGWTVITGTFTADSAYTYIGVGNFFDDASTNEIVTCQFCQQPYNIYYVDDISVVALQQSPVSQFTFAGSNCAGNTIIFTDNSSNNPTNWNWTVSPQNGATFTNPTAQNPSIAFNLPGTYTIGLQAGNIAGPGSLYTNTIQIYPKPIVTINISNNASVCAGSSLQLNASGANTYYWHTTLQTGNNITIYPQQSAYYSVSGTSAFGCIGIDSVFVVVRPNPLVNVTALSNIICYGNSTQLQASGASNYIWNPGNSTGNPNQVSPLSTTVYTVVGTNQFGCSATSQHTIQVDECVGLNELNKSFSESHIYPNPSDGNIEFGLQLPENANIFICNQLGQIVKVARSNEVNQNQKRLNLTELSKGIYFIKVETETLLLYSKLIIQ